MITLKEGEQVGEEGCLSLPGKVAVVKRPDHVICEAFDEDMNPITVEGFGLFARALCHETDHFGWNFISRCSRRTSKETSRWKR